MACDFSTGNKQAGSHPGGVQFGRRDKQKTERISRAELKASRHSSNQLMLNYFLPAISGAWQRESPCARQIVVAGHP
jgi:hypothetical protein